MKSHHAKFECNYGDAVTDRPFGTFRASMSNDDTDYKGGATDDTFAAIAKPSLKQNNNGSGNADGIRERKTGSKGGHRSDLGRNNDVVADIIPKKMTSMRSAKFSLVPRTPDLVYYIVTLAISLFVCNDVVSAAAGSEFSQERVFLTSFICALGPCVSACVLHVVFSTSQTRRKPWSYPFQNEGFVFIGHTVGAVGTVVMPVAHALWLALGPK